MSSPRICNHSLQSSEPDPVLTLTRHPQGAPTTRTPWIPNDSAATRCPQSVLLRTSKRPRVDIRGLWEILRNHVGADPQSHLRVNATEVGLDLWNRRWAASNVPLLGGNVRASRDMRCSRTRSPGPRWLSQSSLGSRCLEQGDKFKRHGGYGSRRHVLTSPSTLRNAWDRAGLCDRPSQRPTSPSASPGNLGAVRGDGWPCSLDGCPRLRSSQIGPLIGPLVFLTPSERKGSGARKPPASRGFVRWALLDLNQ